MVTSTQHYTMLQRDLLYTRLTRSKQLVVLIGQKKAVWNAVRGIKARRRWSKLCELLMIDDSTFATQQLSLLAAPQSTEKRYPAPPDPRAVGVVQQARIGCAICRNSGSYAQAPGNPN